MNHKIEAIYHVLLKLQFGVWITNPFEGHLVQKELHTASIRAYDGTTLQANTCARLHLGSMWEWPGIRRVSPTTPNTWTSKVYVE